MDLAATRTLYDRAFATVVQTGPKGTMAERICKAMDTPINGDWKGLPVAEILEDLEKKFDGNAFRTVGAPLHQEIQMDINLGQVPVGSAIRAINDMLPTYQFVVRDYGILFPQKDLLPPRALLLHDFWKSDMGKGEPKEASGDKKKQ